MSSKTIYKFSSEGYSEFYGAHSFKRLMGNEIKNPFSMKILTGVFKLGGQVKVILKNVKYNLPRI